MFSTTDPFSVKNSSSSLTGNGQVLKGDGKRNNVTSPFPILTLTHRSLAKVASLGARLKSKIQDSDALEIFQAFV